MSGTSDAAASPLCRATTTAVLRDAGRGSRHLLKASRNYHVQYACNSTQNAGSSASSKRLVRVTHPFHPLSGQALVCVGERFNRYGKRVLLQVDDKTFCSVPPQWTDLTAPDPEVVMGEQRALFRVADLVELERLVVRLSKRRSMEASDGV